MTEKILKEIEKVFKKSNETFYSYAWRENVCNFLTKESKYNKLIEWIDTTISLNSSVVCAFNPADKDDSYINGYFKTYKESCAIIAMLINFKIILLDSKTSTKMRENIEQTLCKLFNISYTESLNGYK